jgi:hypothetical protein
MSILRLPKTRLLLILAVLPAVLDPSAGVGSGDARRGRKWRAVSPSA